MKENALILVIGVVLVYLLYLAYKKFRKEFDSLSKEEKNQIRKDINKEMGENLP